MVTMIASLVAGVLIGYYLNDTNNQREKDKAAREYALIRAIEYDTKRIDYGLFK